MAVHNRSRIYSPGELEESWKREERERGKCPSERFRLLWLTTTLGGEFGIANKDRRGLAHILKPASYESRSDNLFNLVMPSSDVDKFLRFAIECNSPSDTNSYFTSSIRGDSIRISSGLNVSGHVFGNVDLSVFPIQYVKLSKRVYQRHPYLVQE